MYIKYRFLLYFLFMAATLASCSDQHDGINNSSDDITFASGVSKYVTRLSTDGGQWTAGDQIGIYMVESGTATVKDYVNIPYVAESSAQTTVFKPAATGMVYPDAPSVVDFIAYYPYSSAVANFVYPVSLANQSAGLTAHDLLCAKADNSGNGFSTGSVTFGFTHRLSKITMNFVDEDNNAITPDANGIIIGGMNTTAAFDLKTEALTDIATLADIIPFGQTSSAEAILLPFTIGEGHQVTIVVDGNRYLWTMNNSHAGLEIKPGHAYTFRVTVKTSSAEVEAVLVDYDGNSIAPWGDGGADNKPVVPTEDIEIPDDYETIEVPTGESFGTALSGATEDKVAIILADGGVYEESENLDIPTHVKSLIIAGKGGTTPPSIKYNGTSMSAAVELIHLYNVDIHGTATSYFLNQTTAVTINQFIIENCKVHDMRGIFRLRTADSSVNSYKITNSIIYNIGNYNLLAIDGGSVPNVEISKSTIYNLEARGLYFNKMTTPATVTIDQCTFHLILAKYYIAEFSSAGGALTFTNNILGLPYTESGKISVSYNATSTTASGNYYVSDTTWQGSPVGEDCGFTASALFADPANGNFTQSKLTAGDPRWY